MSETQTFQDLVDRSGPVMALLKERDRLMRYVLKQAFRVSLRDLQRLNATLDKLSDADIKRVCTFAEGLAEWACEDACSPDAENSDR